MKILQIISAFPPAYAYGGPALSTYELAKQLVRRGHEVSVYTTDVYDASRRCPVDSNPTDMDGIEVYRFRNLSNSLTYRRNLSLAPGLARYLARQIGQFDVVHLNELRTFQAIAVSHAAHRQGIPYILHPHGDVDRIGLRLAKACFDRVFGRRLMEGAGKIVASSGIEAAQYPANFPWLDPGKIARIPNPVSLDLYERLPPRGLFRQRHGIGEGEKIVLYLSRIHRIKGADVLLDAFRRLSPLPENVRLVIAGPDENYQGELRRLAEAYRLGERVLFPGPLYGERKAEAFVDADLFVLPSRYDSFGNVVFEALACGKTVLVTSNCGVSEWISGYPGRVVGCDSAELASALRTLLDGDLSAGTARTRALFRSMYDASEICRRYEQIYSEVST